MTVANTTITGAKSLTYEKVASAADSQPVPVLTIVVFETDAISAGVISTNSGNDSVQFLGGAKNYVDLGAGADSLYGADRHQQQFH